MRALAALVWLQPPEIISNNQTSVRVGMAYQEVWILQQVGAVGLWWRGGGAASALAVGA